MIKLLRYFLLANCLLPTANFLFAGDTLKPNNPKPIVFVLPILEEIGPVSSRHIQEGFRQAEKANADYIILHLNTYGGAVDDADKTRTLILKSKIPVFAFVDNNAASAGALIAISCDSIYMAPGANIGAATVVGQDGAPAPEKYQSYMRSMLRSTAEQSGRNPKIAEAMNDPRMFIPGVNDSGKVLTFTTSEAIKNNYCEGEAKSVEEVLKLAHVEKYEIQTYEISGVGKIIDWLINPVISGFLIMIIIAGIYYEFQAPGTIFPIAASILAALLYFAPHYLEGLAENWEILLFIAGLILLALEIFVIPGFGVAGVLGILFIVLGLTLSLVKNVPSPNFPVNLPEGNAFVKALFIVIVSMIISIGLSFYLFGRFIKSSAFSRVSVQSKISKEEGFMGVDMTSQNLVGKSGIAFTILRPSGKVEIDGNIFDATAETGYIDKGEKIEVVRFETAQLFVRKS
ncbi:MAG: nodulation protein NfeD [Bacteroidetes bacterium]|nr:nodulation protein NfeD [Bacteroidota bacterium]